MLSAALDDNHIDAATLDAMLGAIRDALPMFRRYLRRQGPQARLGTLALVGSVRAAGRRSRKFSWLEAREFIVERFASFSPDLGQFAARAFDDRWIDACRATANGAGRFAWKCWASRRAGSWPISTAASSRPARWPTSWGTATTTIASAAWSRCVRGAPMTLAETASIFCETLIAESALEDASPAEQLEILEAQLCGATQVCLDITSRYRFETEVFARRGDSELSADEFCELMRAAQAETYADAVEPDTYHPYMWLWKPHYYSHEQNFYNFPYAFGHLFSLGLFAIYRREGASFVPRYQELLRATGQDYAAPLAARFGIDITRGEFWRDSLQIIDGGRFAAVRERLPEPCLRNGATNARESAGLTTAIVCLLLRRQQFEIEHDLDRRGGARGRDWIGSQSPRNRNQPIQIEPQITHRRRAHARTLANNSAARAAWRATPCGRPSRAFTPAAASLIRPLRKSAVAPRRPHACHRPSHVSWASQ